MNENEIARIAAAANALRPDWPTTSLRTLLGRPELANRSRRDMAVALVWIACESDTKTPARVLEAGPWWKAAGVEAGTNGHQHGMKVYGFNEGDPREVCGICGLHQNECVRRAATNGHEFAARIDCLPPVEDSPWHTEGARCLAGPPDRPCDLRPGHKGDHRCPEPIAARPSPTTHPTKAAASGKED